MRGAVQTRIQAALYDVLATRYASEAMREIWSPEGKILRERQLWIATLRALRDLGENIAEEDIRAYEVAENNIDLGAIDELERRLRHDVKARIQAFNETASAYAGKKLGLIHQGFTSRDLTDNVEQMQARAALQLVRDRAVAVVVAFAKRAKLYRDLPICARTHLMPAQVTTLGKRFATLAEEMILGFHELLQFLHTYPLRGIKGPVGTQTDMLERLCDPTKLDALEEKVCKSLGFRQKLTSVGQVYPRSLDFALVSKLFLLSAAPVNFATMIRLMAGAELAHEGFGDEQIGSSAMPHKMNSRTCERIRSLQYALRGHLGVTESLLGDQWLEGDVSCSAARRVAIQGAFFALDGIFESLLTVLAEMEVFPEMIKAELNRYLPFLTSARLLTIAQKSGLNREEAHDLVGRHSRKAVETLRQGRPHRMVADILADPAFTGDPGALREAAATVALGQAQRHVDEVRFTVDRIAASYPHALDYRPAPIL